MDFSKNKLEFWLTGIGAVAAGCAALAQLNSALSVDATPALQGVTASAALAALITVISIPVGFRWAAIGFIMRIASAFMVIVFAFFASKPSLVLSIAASLAVILSAFLLLMRYLKEVETRGVSRM